MTRLSTPRDLDPTLSRSTMRSSPPIAKYCMRWATRKGWEDVVCSFNHHSGDNSVPRRNEISRFRAIWVERWQCFEPVRRQSAVFRNGTRCVSMRSEPDVSMCRSRSASILRIVAAVVSTSSKTLRAEHSLVARAFDTADSADARRILLVSAHSGDGKSYFARCLAQHATVVTDAPVRVQSLATAELQAGGHGRGPSVEGDLVAYLNGYVWIDGLALLEGQGPAALTPSVRASIDGALVVVRGMVTTRAEVEDCADRLRSLGVPVLGGVWNESDYPPVAEAVRSIGAGLWSWPPRLPPRMSARQFRRSP